MRSPSLLLLYIKYAARHICAVGVHRRCTGPISTYSFIGSQVNTTPRRLNTLRSTSESITVECT